MENSFKRVLVTGGAGYVGSSLVPKLLEKGYEVVVLDLYLYGRDLFAGYRGPKLKEVVGDLRNPVTVKEALTGCDAVIHLACISNDPSFDLNPDLGKSINFDCFRPLLQACKAEGVKRFIYASSSSVYGVKDEPEVHEGMSLEPLTDYSKFKALCEDVLNEERADGFVTCIVRPSTVCGFAPRQRLDVVVNIFANNAFNTGKIKVFGGSQKRPNIHIDDMTDLYLFLLDQPDEKVDGGVWNAGYENHPIMELAEIVRAVVGNHVDIAVEPTDDLRSYHVSSEKMRRELGFAPRYTIEDAVRGLVSAFGDGRLPGGMEDPIYFNIRHMQSVNLK